MKLPRIKNPSSLWLLPFALPIGFGAAFIFALLVSASWSILVWDNEAGAAMRVMILRPASLFFAIAIVVISILIAFND